MTLAIDPAGRAPPRAGPRPAPCGLAPARPSHGAVLLVSADPEIRETLPRLLERAGFEVAVASGMSAAERALLERPVRTCVLDLSATGPDEMALCRRLAGGPRRLITLTAPEGDIDRIVHLEAGADDSLSKPVNPRELLARVRAQARRQATPEATTGTLEFAGWLFDARGRRLRAPNGRLAPLTQASLALLQAFLDHPEETLSRRRLAELLGEPGSPGRMIDWRVSRLRKQLDVYRRGGALIRTVHNAGYVLDVAVRRG